MNFPKKAFAQFTLLKSLLKINKCIVYALLYLTLSKFFFERFSILIFNNPSPPPPTTWTKNFFSKETEKSIQIEKPI